MKDGQTDWNNSRRKINTSSLKRERKREGKREEQRDIWRSRYDIRTL